MLKFFSNLINGDPDKLLDLENMPDIDGVMKAVMILLFEEGSVNENEIVDKLSLKFEDVDVQWGIFQLEETGLVAGKIIEGKSNFTGKDLVKIVSLSAKGHLYMRKIAVEE